MAFESILLLFYFFLFSRRNFHSYIDAFSCFVWLASSRGTKNVDHMLHLFPQAPGTLLSLFRMFLLLSLFRMFLLLSLFRMFLLFSFILALGPVPWPIPQPSRVSE